MLTFFNLILAALLSGPIALAAVFMSRRPKSRLRLAWIASAAAPMCFCAAALIYYAASRPDYIGPPDRWSLIRRASTFGYLFIESLVIAIIGFVWSQLRPLGIGRGVVVESEDEVKRSA